MQEAREMLRRWEAGDPEVVALWEMMNQWVYEGFDETYKKLGITFDKVYYESQTYLVGKEMVLEGVKKAFSIKKKMGRYGLISRRMGWITNYCSVPTEHRYTSRKTSEQPNSDSTIIPSIK